MGREALLMIINSSRRRFMASRSPFRDTLKMKVSAVLHLMWKGPKIHRQSAAEGFSKAS